MPTDGDPADAVQPEPATAGQADAEPTDAELADVGPANAESAASWRIPLWMPIAKGVGALVFAVAGPYLSEGRAAGIAISAIAALALAAYATRDLLAPVRLAADTTGITTITGLRHHVTLTWADVERMRVDARKRLGGMKSELLEIDADDRLYLFSRAELGADCHHVLATLVAIRTGRPLPAPPD